MLHSGILLLGPTGSGKTPLGDWIEAAGLGGRKYRHFDFGANLRQVVAGEVPGKSFSAEELAFLRDVLRSGALLEDEHFPIAERILAEFLRRECFQDGVEVVLNGLPRHVGQAEAVGRIVRVHTVVLLECSRDVVLARIGTNVGGDRSERSDDARSDVQRKLTIYAERTKPLIRYYREAGSTIIDLPVTVEMTPESAWTALRGRVAVRGV